MSGSDVGRFKKSHTQIPLLVCIPITMASRYNTTLTLSVVESSVLASVNIIFSIGGSIGNLGVCVAFLLYRNLRNNMNIFIFSLACSDLLVCLIAQPMFIARLIQYVPDRSYNPSSEDVRSRLTWISLLASIGNIAGVTCDRYFVISHPLRYATCVTTFTACASVAVVWTIASVLGIMTESFFVAKVVGQIYVVVVLFGMIIPLYCRILCIARRHARTIHTSLSRVQVNNYEFEKLNIQKADRNSLKTLGLISGIFIIGWLPLLILPFFYRAGANDRSVLLHAMQWANTLALCSSACNPVVYSWRDRRFRKALNIAYGKWKARRSISVNDSHGGTSLEKFGMRRYTRTESLPRLKE